MAEIHLEELSNITLLLLQKVSNYGESPLGAIEELQEGNEKWN